MRMQHRLFEFLLTVMWEALKEISHAQQVMEDIGAPVKLLLEKLGEDVLSAQKIMERLGLKNRASF